MSTITTKDGTQIYYKDWGSGQPVVFKAYAAVTPLGRIGQPEDIAPAVVFLASPDSGWITGEANA